MGTTTKKDTVNAALREIVDRRRHAAAVEWMRQMVAEGEIDFSVIEQTDDASRAGSDASSVSSGAEHHAA